MVKMADFFGDGEQGGVKGAGEGSLIPQMGTWRHQPTRSRRKQQRKRAGEQRNTARAPVSRERFRRTLTQLLRLQQRRPRSLLLLVTVAAASSLRTAASL